MTGYTTARMREYVMKSTETIWFVSEVYFPDEQGTAFYTTGLAEGLARHYRVVVLCSDPTVTARGTRVPRAEVRNGVRIKRCKGTTFNKDNLLLRAVNILTYSLALIIRGLVLVRKNDIVIAVTSPPSVPFIAKCICWLRGAKCVLRLEDVYPETLVATGLLRKSSMVTRLLALLTRMLYRNVELITVLGRDMKALAEKKIRSHSDHIHIIRSWADTDIVSPQPKAANPLLRELGLTDKFVVSCVGNMGRAQAVELMLEAVTMLREHPQIHFLFIGSGAKKGWLEKEVATRKLENITVLNHRPRTEQAIFLNACDISIISLLPGMTGAGVPSRTYNIMAAGKPIIALTGRDSEVSLLVQDESIGWVVPPDNAGELATTVLNACSDPDRLATMGARAAQVATKRFSREIIIDEYKSLLESRLLATSAAKIQRDAACYAQP